MKKIFYYISAAVLVLGAVSCAKEITREGSIDKDADRQISFWAEINDETVTKTTLSGNDAEGYKVLWSEGDEIIVKDSWDSRFTLVEGAGTTRGKFVGTSKEGDGTYKVFYATNGKDFNGTSYYNGAKGISYAPMAATITISNDEVTTTDFKNICGMLRLSMKGFGTVSQIRIYADQSLRGRFDIGPDGSAHITTAAAMNDYLTQKFDDGVQLSDAGTDFYISMVPNDYTGVKIEVTGLDGNTYTKTLKAGKTLGIARAQITPVSLSVSIPEDLSADGTANCYIVSGYGDCKFDATKKGHTNETVGTIASAEVLWESFGNDVQPQVGDVVKNVSVKDGYVYFTTSGKDGNAVIAVKDATGNILWSWHIWVCKGFDPVATAQVYNNNAGTVMDRNLGATSAAKGDVKALGLLYQWGRKDPFLSGSSINSDTRAKSTITWPSTVSSDASNGTIDYVVKHPTTFVTFSGNGDWYYTGSSSTDNTRWNSGKGMYDPCPNGWRVPDGGSNGLWAKAFGTSSSLTGSSNWDSTNMGMNFGATAKKLGSGSIWYPASGYQSGSSGTLGSVGNGVYYRSCTPYDYRAYSLFFGNNGYVSPSSIDNRAYGESVRCVKE